MKKPIYKKWWFWLVIIILIVAIGSMGQEEQAAPNNESSAVASDQAETEDPGKNTAAKEPVKEPAKEPAEEPVKEPVKEPAKEPEKEQKPINKPTISKEEFTKIKNGMTYKEVVKIIGSEGEVLSETGEENSQFHTIMIMYEGEGMLGANANFMFQGGKLINKSQIGLE